MMLESKKNFRCFSLQTNFARSCETLIPCTARVSRNIGDSGKCAFHRTSRKLDQTVKKNVLVSREKLEQTRHTTNNKKLTNNKC